MSLGWSCRAACIPILLACFSSPVHADAADDAYKMCRALKSSGATECDVHVWGHTVDARIPTSPSEAQEICNGVADQMAGATTSFAGAGWTLQIFSPYSGDHPIATCPLR
jgi:hypothetical protein